MPQHIVTAFNYTQIGAFGALYNTSVTATLDDDDTTYLGQADADETVSINGGAFGTTDGPPYIITMDFIASGGTAHVEQFYFFNTGGEWFFIPGPGSAFTVGAILGSLNDSTQTGWNYSAVTCFTQGTMIETDTGRVPVEDLVNGCKIRTKSNGYQPLRNVLTRELTLQALRDNPKLRPIRITAGALGKGLPKYDLCVSRQHRLLVQTKIIDRMFGVPEALVAAARLTDIAGVFVEPATVEITYYHLLFDRHEVIYAEGAPTESFYAGVEALKALPLAVQEEFETLFGAEGAPESACLIPTSRQQRELVGRHMKNNKRLLESFH